MRVPPAWASACRSAAAQVLSAPPQRWQRHLTGGFIFVEFEGSLEEPDPDAGEERTGVSFDLAGDSGEPDVFVGGFGLGMHSFIVTVSAVAVEEQGGWLGRTRGQLVGFGGLGFPHEVPPPPLLGG